jgi:hypothetical protein
MGANVVTRTKSDTAPMSPAARVTRSIGFAVSSPVTKRAVQAVNDGMLAAGRKPAAVRRRAKHAA